LEEKMGVKSVYLCEELKKIVRGFFLFKMKIRYCRRSLGNTRNCFVYTCP
jgi:hypothetical protein